MHLFTTTQPICDAVPLVELMSETVCEALPSSLVPRLLLMCGKRKLAWAWLYSHPGRPERGPYTLWPLYEVQKIYSWDSHLYVPCWSVHDWDQNWMKRSVILNLRLHINLWTTSNQEHQKGTIKQSSIFCFADQNPWPQTLQLPTPTSCSVQGIGSVIYINRKIFCTFWGRWHVVSHQAESNCLVYTLTSTISRGR